jgi:hypothetical protein
MKSDSNPEEYTTTANVIPVDGNKKTSDNYDILPTYSESNEK